MTFGFIGLGHIGREIALGLATSSTPTTVFDVAPPAAAALADAGATVAASAAAVGAASAKIGVCVRNDQDVLDVIAGREGVLQGAKPGTLVLIHSTVRPSTVQKVAELAERVGVRVVDAPVSRATAVGEEFKAVYMLGGSHRDLAEARQVVAFTAKEIVEAGPLGSAMALKLCNNLVTYLEFLAGNEAHRLAIQTGLDPALLLQVMTANGNATSGMQQLMKARLAAPGKLEGQREAFFTAMASLGEKDLDCALEAAEEYGLSLPGAALARARIRDVFLSAVDGK